MPLYRWTGSVMVPVIAPVTTVPTTNPRESLVYGQYLPVANVTAGLTDAAKLTEYNSPTTQTLTLTDGAVISDKIVYGDIRPPATHNSDIVLTNCRLRGGPHVPSTNDAVVNCQSTRSGTGRLILRDCEIDPQLPALNRDGVRGNRVLVERSWIHDVIDGFAPWATTAQNGGNAYSYLYGSIVERLRYGFPDYENGVSGTDPATVTYPTKPADWEHNDGTHNDCVAINGGKQIGIKGNLLRGSGVNLPGTANGVNPSHPQIQASGYSYGSGILITNTVSNPTDKTVVVEENWFWGANAHINTSIANVVADVKNNRHYRAVFVGSTSSGYWVRIAQRAGTDLGIASEVWVDGPYTGQVLTEPRDRGITFNS